MFSYRTLCLSLVATAAMANALEAKTTKLSRFWNDTFLARVEVTSTPSAQTQQSVVIELGRPDEAQVRMVMEWVSNVLPIKNTTVLPNVERFPSTKFASIEKVNLPSARRPETAAIAIRNRAVSVVAYYDDATRTIYLPETWTGETPAEMSTLVNAAVYHLQNVANLKYDCMDDRRMLAYKAQERWLNLYELNLGSEFGIDEAVRLLITQCSP